jgi:carbamoyltransferase
LPAITHVDGSARIQTVDRRTSPRFAALLERFEKRTGCPILLNTSFNMRGEPIVCSPVDAIMCFVRSRIDCLVLEEFLLERAGIAPVWENTAATMPIRNIQAVSQDVYTLV